MRRLIGTAYSSTQFCKGLGMTERNLELYFREALGVRPKAWFQCLSLHHARTMLRAKATGRGRVTEVALACGFDHFGRFSEAYRELFGARGPLKPFHLASSQLHRGKSAGSPRVAKNASASTKWPWLTLSSTICGHCC